MKIIVTGGRNYSDVETIFTVLMDSTPTEIIQGGASGADYFAREYARIENIPCKTYEAEWAKYGRKAGPLRNKRMLIENLDATLIAFPGGQGTSGCVKIARELRMNVLDIRGLE